MVFGADMVESLQTTTTTTNTTTITINDFQKFVEMFINKNLYNLCAKKKKEKRW